MSGVRKAEHATIRVKDLETAVEFYENVLGLIEIERSDGVVYLGCGLDENYDVGLMEGGTGIDHFAIRVDDEAALESRASQLDAAGVAAERTDGVEPNQVAGLRFELPSGIYMEFVVVEDMDYHHLTRSVAGRDRLAPLDFDHPNLMIYDVDADLDFLANVLDLQVSDVIVGESGFTIQAWLRLGDHHHDLGLSLANDVVSTLNHIAFEMESIDHMKAFCDRLIAEGYRLELGLSRHNAGGNVFAYLWSPGGNRVELTTEMATVDPGAPKGVREIAQEDNTVSAWGGVVPSQEFLERGS
jgi:catechol 2,3-dioxygenase